MARFKFHSAIEDAIIEKYYTNEIPTFSAVQAAADSRDFNLDDDNIDKIVKMIYSTEKYWSSDDS